MYQANLYEGSTYLACQRDYSLIHLQKWMLECIEELVQGRGEIICKKTGRVLIRYRK